MKNSKNKQWNGYFIHGNKAAEKLEGVIMSQSGTGFGERCIDDNIRDILREKASREKPIGQSEIIKYLEERGIVRTRTVVRGFAYRVGAREYVSEEECDELIKQYHIGEREMVFIKKGIEGRTVGYWMLEPISPSEWMLIMDSVLYSKMLTKKEADNLIKRLIDLGGKKLSDLMKYRYRMKSQPYFVGDEYMDGKTGYIESRVLKQVRLIREAIDQKKKVKFELCMYDYGDREVRLVPYGKHGKVISETPKKYKEDVHRIVSPFEIIFSNGRYYMLGADIETERRADLKYKLYRVDLMTDVSITRAIATTKEEAGVHELEDLFKFRLENPYMFIGNVETVRIRVDSDQFTQIVDWFSDGFRVIHYEDEEKYYDIDVMVNIESFKFFLLQYSGCVKVLDTGRNAEKLLRSQMRSALKTALDNYKEEK